VSWRTPPEPIPAEQIAQTVTADVVVIGLGYAGTTALRAAQEAGASTVGIEFMNEKYYKSYGRDIGHLNSKFLERRGVPKVDPVDFYNEWMRRAGNRANGELIMKFAKKSGEAFDWFVDPIDPAAMDNRELVHVAFWPDGGANFKKELLEKGYCELNGYRFWNGTAQFPYDDPMGWKGYPTLPDICRANHKKAVEEGAKIFYATEALQLVRENGRVTAVIARDRRTGELTRYEGKKAVILAAGDFAQNSEMLQELSPDITDLYAPDEKPARNSGRNGRGQQMGVWVGGRLETRPLPTMGGNCLPLNGGIAKFGAVWFDEHGKRFCNEIFGGMELAGMAGNQTVRNVVYRVFDEKFLEHELSWAIPAHGSFDETHPEDVKAIHTMVDYAKTHDDGHWENGATIPMDRQDAYYGRTPEELAKNAGLTGEAAENLIAGIHRYNEMCAAGRDEDFGRDPKVLDPLEGMLFLEVKPLRGFGHMLVSVGGLVTDGDQRVLDENYQIILGLYATGNCCGRRFGTQYFTPIAGVSIGIAMTLGREAGIAAATLE
jgi:hypothetical protein